MMPVNADNLKVAPRRDKLLELPELGAPLRLMQLSARVALKSRALQLRAAKGEDIEEEQTMLLYMNGLVDGAGKQLFSTVEAATAFLDKISTSAHLAIMSELGALLKLDPSDANPSTPNTNGA